MATRLVICLALACCMTGCDTSRGIPTHGGGKRFDEEQRIVATSIRQALGGMDLKELRGKRVALAAECLGHEGGGSMVFPGVNYVGVSGNLSKNQEDPYQPNTTRYTNVAGVSGSIGFQPRPALGASASTASDLNYLRSVLDTMLRLDGMTPTGDRPEATLVILVDVLGVNRTRREFLLFYIEDYQASCEITYYALDAEGKLLFPPRQSGASSLYQEQHALGLCKVLRSSQSVAPLVPPIPVSASEPPAASQPEP